MKILITGGAGFLGSNLASQAIFDGDEVIIFDNLSRMGSRKNLDWLITLGKIQFIHGDIRNHDDVENLVKTTLPDAVFHLAGQVAMTTSIEFPRFDFEINAVGTFNMLDSIRKYSPNSVFIYSSTNKVYGDLNQLSFSETATRYLCNEFPNGFDENLQLSFHSPYGCSKGAADQLVLDYHRIFGLHTLVFRHSSMYGNHQFSSYDQGWIGWFCRQALETLNDPNHRFHISGNGKQVRDVLHASDMKSLYKSALHTISKAEGHAFNIGGSFENSLSLLELFNILEAELNVKLNYDLLPPRISDQLVFIADIAKAKNVMNWKPDVDIVRGIREYIEWLTVTARKDDACAPD